MRFHFKLSLQKADKAQPVQDGTDPSSTTSNSTTYVVEKEWFDNFLAYKVLKDHGTTGANAAFPGKISNRKLLLISSQVITEDVSSLETMSEKVDTTDNNNLETDERRLRRKRWQGIEERNKEEEKKTNGEILGGNMQCRPEIREGVDYVLVGKKTWSFLSHHFSFDVELPQQQQQQPQRQPTVSLDSIATSNHSSDSKQSEMDAGDAGSSVAVAPSVSSLLSEGSSKSESGDDLVSFPCTQWCIMYIMSISTHFCHVSLVISFHLWNVIQLQVPRLPRLQWCLTIQIIASIQPSLRLRTSIDLILARRQVQLTMTLPKKTLG